MNKLIYFIRVVLYVFTSSLIVLIIIPLWLLPSLPVYYLLYILIYLFFLIVYLYILSGSIICFYIFLIVAGGIIVTFLFFIVFVTGENFIIVFLYIFILLVIIYVMVELVFGYNILNQVFSHHFIQNNLSAAECYVSIIGISLTFVCILFLLYIIYVTVKMSTFLKSSPIRRV